MQAIDRQVINGYVVKVLLNGPTRVVVESSGGYVDRAIDAERAAREYKIRPDVCWIRDDGWSLAARFEDADAARRMYEGHWVALINLNTFDVHFPQA